MLVADTILQGRYRIVRSIGQGGMGAVYVAKDQRLGSSVALKQTLFSDEKMLNAFEREARLLAGLRHPALPKVSDHFTEDAGQFLVMEFIPGDDLHQSLAARGYAFSPDDVLRWADQLLDALDYLHTQKLPIIHRDIKPQNLKLTDRGQIILLDFGLAKGSAGEVTRAISNVSVLGYTPGYAPLEQIQGAGTDARSDLYSLAATLYHLMSNATPPDALARAGAVLNGQADPLQRADEINPHVPVQAAAVLMRAMALNRDQRPASAAEMRRALNDASKAPVVAVSSEAPTILAQPTAVIAAKTESAHAQASTIMPPALSTEARPSAREPRGTLAQAARKSNRLIWVSGGIIALLAASIAIAVMTRNGSTTTNVNSNSASIVPDASQANTNQPYWDQPSNSNTDAANASSTNANTRSRVPDTQQAKKKPTNSSPRIVPLETPEPVDQGSELIGRKPDPNQNTRAKQGIRASRPIKNSNQGRIMTDRPPFRRPFPLRKPPLYRKP